MGDVSTERLSHLKGGVGHPTVLTNSMLNTVLVRRACSSSWVCLPYLNHSVSYIKVHISHPNESCNLYDPEVALCNNSFQYEQNIAWTHFTKHSTAMLLLKALKTVSLNWPFTEAFLSNGTYSSAQLAHQALRFCTLRRCVCGFTVRESRELFIPKSKNTTVRVSKWVSLFALRLASLVHEQLRASR